MDFLLLVSQETKLRAKTGYGTAQEGALVYITTADTSPAGQTINVTAPGYYYFDGTVWQIVVGASGTDGDAWGVDGEDQTSNVTRSGNIEITDALGTIRTEVSNNGIRGNTRYLNIEGTRTGRNNPIGGMLFRNTDGAATYTAASIEATNANEGNADGANDGKLLFQTADDGTLTTKMVIENQGNVGIGTENPEAKLTVTSTGVTGNTTGIRLENGTSNSVMYQNANSDLVIQKLNQNNQLVIDNAGGVGINTDDPTVRLDVNGDARIRTIPSGSATDDVLTTDTNGNLRQRTAAQIVDAGGGLDADGDAWGVDGEDVASNVSRTGNVTIANTNKQALTLQTTDNTLSNGIAFQNSGLAYTWNIFRESAGGADADLVFSGGGVENDPNNLPERMRIEQNGNVGIGTATPRGGLEISKSPVVGQNVPALSQAVNVANSEDYSLVLSNSDNATIGMVSGFSNASGSFDTYLQSRVFAANGAAQNLLLNPLGGSVGIGIDIPTRRLSVNGIINNAGAIEVNELGVGDRSAFVDFHAEDAVDRSFRIRRFDGANGIAQIQNNGTGNIEFLTDFFENRMTISSSANNGRVGIGIGTPASLLDVNGDARIRTIPNGASTDFVLTSDNNGNVRRRTMQQVVDDGTSAVQQTLATAIVTNNLVIPLTTTLGNPGSTPGESVNQATNINFNVESVDPGNNFNIGTDTYTAPETGSYLVTLTASPNSSPSRNDSGFYYATNLQVFNATTNVILADNRTIRYATPGTTQLGSATSLQGIVSLTAGDQVTARVAIPQLTNAAAGASEGTSLPDQITFAPQTQNRVIFSIVKL